MHHAKPILVALACGSAAALAQPAETQLRYEVRKFDAGHNAGWATTLDALPGDRVEVRALVSYIGSAPVIALGQVTFQPTVSNWGTGDTLLTNALLGETGPLHFPDGIGSSGGFQTTPPAFAPDAPGVYGRITPFNAAAVAGGWPYTTFFYRGHVHAISGISYLRIARSDVTNWFGVGATSGGAAINNITGAGGITCWQGSLGDIRSTQAPPPVLSTQNVLVFKFGFTLSGDPAPRDLEVNTPANGFGRRTENAHWLGPATGWFLSTNENGPGAHLTNAIAVPAIVRVVPSPAAAALGAVACILAARRRR